MFAAGCGKDEAVILPERETVFSGEQLIYSGDTERAENLRSGDEEVLHEPCVFNDSKPETVTVYVCGAVMSPGVYTLEEGRRIADAIELAGGMTGEADRNYINQAMLLTDCQKIYVPVQGEAVNSAYVEDSTVEGVQASGAASSMVNINTGNVEELMTLPGIGEAKARLIIEYRESNGRFSSVEDIMKINGIKEGMFNKIKDKICI
jgi:competence protein ComEA